MPLDAPADDVVAAAHGALRGFDDLMHGVHLHEAVSLCDEYIRAANKRWADGISAAEKSGDEEARRVVLATAVYELRVAALLMHPIVPRGCELICERLGFAPERFFSWDASFDGLSELCSNEEAAAGWRAVEPLPPRFDFFPKHESQIKKK